MSSDAERPARRPGSDPRSPWHFIANSIQQDNVPQYEDGLGRSLEEYQAFTGLTDEELSGPVFLLDIGAGPTARFARELKEKNPEATIISMSPDFKDDEHRQKLIESGGVEAGPAAAGVAQKLPFKDESFTHVTMVFTSMYLTVGRMMDSMYEMARVLKPGGKGVTTPLIVLNNPNSERYTKMRGLMQRFRDFIDLVEDLKRRDNGTLPHIEFVEAKEAYLDGTPDPDVTIYRMIVRPREKV